ncbi:MAG TPA: hypothetical protein EYO59_06075, partial [Chromatiaceae bacterium]|nr:hypothetical protein [Chromatiaceae bacterium]
MQSKRAFDFAAIASLTLQSFIVVLYGAQIIFPQYVTEPLRFAVPMTAFLGCVLGFLGARRMRTLVIRPLFFAFAPAWLTFLALQYFSDSLLPLTSLLFRVGFLTPALWWLCGYFGASVGYLLRRGSKQIGSLLGFERWLGCRFLLSSTSGVFSTVTLISIMGVAVGVFLIIFAMGILSGFEHDLQSKIIGANAHVLVQGKHQSYIKRDVSVEEKILNIVGVQATSPYIEAEVGFASQQNDTVGFLI